MFAFRVCSEFLVSALFKLGILWGLVVYIGVFDFGVSGVFFVGFYPHPPNALNPNP